MCGFRIDRLDPSFLGSIERTFLFICQTHPFLKRFIEKNIFEGFRKNGREKVTRAKAEAKTAATANNDGDKTTRPPISAGRAS